VRLTDAEPDGSAVLTNHPIVRSTHEFAERVLQIHYEGDNPRGNESKYDRPRDEESEVLELREEERKARKRAVETRQVRIDKDVVEEEQMLRVPVTREEVTIERRRRDQRVHRTGSRAGPRIMSLSKNGPW
jgi:stress response protein YsnF